MCTKSLTPKRLATYAAFCALAACASTGPGKMVSETSEPTPVEVSADNAQLLEQLEPSLVVTFAIEGDTATLVEARVLMVRSSVRGRQEGETVTVRAFSGNTLVSESHVADQRLNVEEGGGLVILDKRVLSVAVAMPQPVDSVVVGIPGVQEPSKLDVKEAVQAFCKEFPRTKACSAAAK